MRLIGVVAPDDPFGWASLSALASLGWQVHAVLTAEMGDVPATHSCVRVHDFRPAELRRGSVPTRIATTLAGRVGLALSRTSARASPILQAKTGLEIALPDVWHRRETVTGSVTSTQLGALLEAFGHPDRHATQPVVSSMARLLDEVQPEIVLSMGTAAAASTFGAREMRPQPAWAWFVGGLASDLLWNALDKPFHVGARAVLGAADGYLASCVKDAQLVTDLGFLGASELMPCGAGVAGSSEIVAQAQLRPPSTRKTILVDGRHDVRRRGLVAIAALRVCADAIRQYRIEVYSAAEDVHIAAVLARTDCGLDIRIRPTWPSMRKLLGAATRARASISVSAGEEADPWTLTTMAVGAFPIRSRTAGRDEREVDGQTTLLVHPDEPAEIAAALHRAVEDDGLVDGASAANRRLAAPLLDPATAAQKLTRMRAHIQELRR